MDGTVGKVYPVHNNIFKFGTKGQESLDENMAMPSDLENFSPSIDGTVEEWYCNGCSRLGESRNDRKETEL